ncbi:MAG: hypothetical protein K2X86_14355, partial [Cytophagaceae bacterium]|nr:hypothetical protein [Cytophagaceae bacterium]
MKTLHVLFLIVFLALGSIGYGATFTVTSLMGNDYSCAANGTNTNVCLVAGTLGWAISSANANAGADIINFNLPSGSNIDVQNPAWLLITEGNLTIDGTSGPMAAAWTGAGSCNPIIQITCGFSNGFDINGVAGVTIRGLVFNMQGNCVTFRGAGVTSGGVQGCWAGLTLAGNAASANIAQQAIQISGGASGVIIGGNNCALRNVLLANNNGGIYCDNGDNNTIIGNYFNTNAAGAAHVSPGGGQAAIRMVNGSTGNIIGTNAAGEGNVITINNGQAGIFLESASNNTIIRNCIIGFASNGTTATPAFALTTDHGINVNA